MACGAISRLQSGRVPHLLPVMLEAEASIVERRSAAEALALTRRLTTH